MVTEIGKCLKLIRIKTGDSLRTMSVKLNISAAYLSAIENGKRNIPDNLLNAIFNAYSLDAEEKKKVKDALYSSIDNYKVDMSNISDKKREVLLSLTKDELDESTIDKLCAVIQESNKKEKL